MKSIVPVLLAILLGFTGCGSADTAAELTITAGSTQKIVSEETIVSQPVFHAVSDTGSDTELTLSEEAVPMTETPAATNRKSYGERVTELINAERTAAGLAPLTWDPILTAAAQTRSQEVKSTFGHTRPDGTSCFTVLAEHNISYNSTAENIAGRITSPEKVVRAWLNSEGHRKNIFNASFTSVGIGYTDGGYWSLLFIG